MVIEESQRPRRWRRSSSGRVALAAEAVALSSMVSLCDGEKLHKRHQRRLYRRYVRRGRVRKLAESEDKQYVPPTASVAMRTACWPWRSSPVHLRPPETEMGCRRRSAPRPAAVASTTHQKFRNRRGRYQTARDWGGNHLRKNLTPATGWNAHFYARLQAQRQLSRGPSISRRMGVVASPTTLTNGLPRRRTSSAHGHVLAAARAARARRVSHSAACDTTTPCSQRLLALRSRRVAPQWFDDWYRADNLRLPATSPPGIWADAAPKSARQSGSTWS